MTQQTTGTKGAVAITGVASGIGLSTAQLLMARGWQPWLLDLKRDALEAACEKLGLSPRVASSALWRRRLRLNRLSLL